MTTAGTVREPAPAKVNLILHVGPRGPSGLHELCSLFASVDLEDTVSVAVSEGDEVVCRPPVAGRNLAADAVAALRAELGGELPPLRVEIDKRIPVAAGLAGGSADAAATLRACNRIAAGRLGADDLRRVAQQLGSDVPSQVEPRHALVTGTGERVEPIGLPPMTLVLVPAAEGLATGEVYAEADRLASTRERLEPERVRGLADLPLERLAAGLENDLEPAVTVLRPELIDTRTALLRRSALAARVTGSGPTVFGVFASRAAAEAAAADLDERALVVGLRG
ncbi:MAG: 4-(cytidine 5'-diphospho)-2-C-methyl-D-erythritol kinase [Thermoleophilaceae bacterium]